MKPDHSALYASMVERTLREDTPEQECLRCHRSSKMVDEVSLPASPIGAGGDYLLCYDCAVEEIDAAYGSLMEYYRESQ